LGSPIKQPPWQGCHRPSTCLGLFPDQHQVHQTQGREKKPNPAPNPPDSPRKHKISAKNPSKPLANFELIHNFPADCKLGFAQFFHNL
tara:strand:- start:388 stop:651 length:264 start_codon:yes stop_codon:yes gene_type:complete